MHRPPRPPRPPDRAARGRTRGLRAGGAPRRTPRTRLDPARTRAIPHGTAALTRELEVLRSAGGAGTEAYEGGPAIVHGDGRGAQEFGLLPELLHHLLAR